MLSERTLMKLQGIRKCSINGHKVKDLYQMILNAPDLWEQAYGNIYANKGGMTPGVDGQTIDGHSDERAANLRQLLRENRYVPTPAQRVSIPKPNGKLRPLGMPTANDKLVQEVWRMVLESIYEPVFHDTSHGFRPKRSCHTALKKVMYWSGTKWFIEFDIEGYFDNINHEVLIPTVSLDVISLVAGSCGYTKGDIEPRVAQEFAMHLAPQRGLADWPHHRHPPHAQPVTPLRSCYGRRLWLLPRRGTAQASPHDPGQSGGCTREEKRPDRFRLLVLRAPPTSPLFASWPWPRPNALLVGNS